MITPGRSSASVESIHGQLTRVPKSGGLAGRQRKNGAGCRSNTATLCREGSFLKDSGSMWLTVSTRAHKQGSPDHAAKDEIGGSIVRDRRAMSRWLHGMNFRLVCVWPGGMGGPGLVLVHPEPGNILSAFPKSDASHKSWAVKRSFSSDFHPMVVPASV